MTDLPALAYEHAPVGITYTEARVIRWANPRFCDIFGTAWAATIGQPLSEYYPSRAEFDRIGEIGPRIMTDTGRMSDEQIMKRASGGLFWCQVHGQALDLTAPFARAVWTFVPMRDIHPGSDLSAREMQIVNLMAEGLSSKEIGRALSISHRTVEAHKLNLFRKMGTRNSVELVSLLNKTIHTPHNSFPM